MESEIQNIRLFWTPAGRNLKIHSDEFTGAVEWALNWPLTQTDSDMIWYDGTGATLCSHEGYGGLYTYDESTVQEIARTQIIEPTMVKIDVPHSVINRSDHTRMMLSFRFSTLGHQFML